jgi:lysophospholipase L1-like esterase
MAGKYKTQGRTSVINDVLMTDYTATGMEFKAHCSGDVSVTFSASSFKSTYVGTEYSGCYFTVIVDGVKKARDFCFINTTGDVTVKIAENLPEGDHTFEIYRQSEIELATLGIKSVTLKGELLNAPANNDMYIEFVGASQWGGYGNLATNSTPSDDVPSAYYQDGTQALTYLTARNLNADWSVVSVQGIGASWGWQTTSMDTVYKYLRYNKDKNTLYDFARQPDYVVIGLGTNDYSRMSYYNKTTDDLVNSFVDFMALVREKNPNAKIIWVCNMMTSDVNTYVESAVEKFGGENANAYSLQVTKNTAGGKNHPDVAGHKVMADEITAYINKLEGNTTEPEQPDDGIVLYEDFENISDPTTVINDVLKQSWTNPKLCTTDSVSGSKCFSIFAMHQNLFAPIDKDALAFGTIYEISMNWKLLAKTSEENRRLTALQFVGWNPSEGATFKSSYKTLSGSFNSIDATGNWENTSVRFKWIEEFAEYEQVGIRIAYGASEPYVGADDTIYIDDLKLAKADNQDFVPLNFNEPARTEDTIKVLAFGNSFSNDGTTFIDDIAKADGKDIRVADCSIGGCSLERHYSNMLNGYTDYSLNYRTITGTTGFSKVSMQQALMSADWDYITIQQVSGYSGMYDSFEPYLKELIAYFKEMCPDAEILFHATWAYAQDSTHGDFKNYGKDQNTMHEAIEDAYLTASQNYGYARLIPTGEAIRRARATTMGDNFNRDGYHLNDKGRLTAALVWYETFTGISALDAQVNLSSVIGSVGDTAGVAIGVTEEESLLMRTAAHEAAALFKKANETQLAIEAIGEVTENSGDAIAKANALRAELNDDDLLPNLQTLIDANSAYNEFAPDVVIGDVSGDNEIDLEDVNILAQWLAGWDLTVNEDALDVNADGTVNLKDLVLLAQFVAGWEVKLG